MAVERLTDYTRRIWTGLGPDAPEGHDIQVNDVIYYMDSSECCIVTNVHPDGSIDCETLPDVGGGGGGGAGINLRLLANGTYTLLSNSNRPVQIPVEVPDDVTVVLIKVTGRDQTAKSNNSTVAWWRAYNVESYLPATDWPAPQEMKVITTDGKSQWLARTSGNVNSLVWLTNENVLGFTVDIAIHFIFAGDYDWEIWGY